VPRTARSSASAARSPATSIDTSVPARGSASPNEMPRPACRAISRSTSPSGARVRRSVTLPLSRGASAASRNGTAPARCSA
jgi:hypothetical protein